MRCHSHSFLPRCSRLSPEGKKPALHAMVTMQLHCSNSTHRNAFGQGFTCHSRGPRTRRLKSSASVAASVWEVRTHAHEKPQAQAQAQAQAKAHKTTHTSTLNAQCKQAHKQKHKTQTQNRGWQRQRHSSKQHALPVHQYPRPRLAARVSTPYFSTTGPPEKSVQLPTSMPQLCVHTSPSPSHPCLRLLPAGARIARERTSPAFPAPLPLSTRAATPPALPAQTGVNLRLHIPSPLSFIPTTPKPTPYMLPSRRALLHCEARSSAAVLRGLLSAEKNNCMYCAARMLFCNVGKSGSTCME